MAVNESQNKNEQEQAVAAWARLEQRLQAEKASPMWEKWEAELVRSCEEQNTLTGGQRVISIEEQVNRQGNSVPLGRAGHERGAAAIVSLPGGETAEPAPSAAKPKAPRRWLKRHAGKAMAACAAAVLAVVIATPSANEALAAWLNQFRMDDVMVVQEDDLESLWSSFSFRGEETRESINRFGTFENKPTGEPKTISLMQAEEELGFAIPDIKLSDKQLVEASSFGAQVLSLKLNVEEVNKAMRKLGADKLLPASVDGKEIKMNTGSGISVSYRQENGDGTEKSVGVHYNQSPSIQVDPSVDMKEAYEALIRFPALPEHLRNDLQQAVDLEEGKIPLPLLSNERVEKLTIEGTNVYLESYDESRYTSVIWLQDGDVVSAGFSGFEDRSEIEAILTELVRS